MQYRESPVYRYLLGDKIEKHVREVHLNDDVRDLINHEAETTKKEDKERGFYLIGSLKRDGILRLTHGYGNDRLEEEGLIVYRDEGTLTWTTDIKYAVRISARLSKITDNYFDVTGHTHPICLGPEDVLPSTEGGDMDYMGRRNSVGIIAGNIPNGSDTEVGIVSHTGRITIPVFHDDIMISPFDRLDRKEINKIARKHLHRIIELVSKGEAPEDLAIWLENIISQAWDNTLQKYHDK